MVRAPSAVDALLLPDLVQTTEVEFVSVPFSMNLCHDVLIVVIPAKYEL